MTSETAPVSKKITHCERFVQIAQVQRKCIHFKAKITRRTLIKIVARAIIWKVMCKYYLPQMPFELVRAEFDPHFYR
jgi:hypothetical protein